MRSSYGIGLETHIFSVNVSSPNLGIWDLRFSYRQSCERASELGVRLIRVFQYFLSLIIHSFANLPSSSPSLISSSDFGFLVFLFP